MHLLLQLPLPPLLLLLQMLVNYMQLLGLLRLVRINWAEQLSKLLVYLDLTSGATTWVSVECSLDPYAMTPRSVARSIIVLLWPCKWFGMFGWGRSGRWCADRNRYITTLLMAA